MSLDILNGGESDALTVVAPQTEIPGRKQHQIAVGPGCSLKTNMGEDKGPRFQRTGEQLSFKRIWQHPGR